ncbi:MAG: hypothetical protein ACI915_001910 [Gammaproteobacteria bacterium]|jgi:hypothetical protein
MARLLRMVFAVALYSRAGRQRKAVDGRFYSFACFALRVGTAMSSGRSLYQGLDFRLLGKFEGVVYLNAKVSDCALHFRVSQQDLNCPQIRCATVDKRGFSTSQRMCAIDGWV